ncbi:hypothetical protein HY643_03810 [Candidatus Woesearchaeota archaeon]|nr:hypothetical protein [Candidatus Woesearchaeota archaeon]
MKIEVEILKLIDAAERPLSTREIAIQLTKAWHTINTRCLKLQLRGEIDGFKVGNTNIWSNKKW